MRKPKRRPLSTEEAKKILNIFKSVPEWTPVEVSVEETIELGLTRKDDTLSIWISGSCSNPQMVEVENAIAGIDVLAVETRPNTRKNEPAGNAYHYVLQKITDRRFPFILYGPYDRGSIIPHWFNDKDLDVYWKHEK